MGRAIFVFVEGEADLVGSGGDFIVAVAEEFGSADEGIAAETDILFAAVAVLVEAVYAPFDEEQLRRPVVLPDVEDGRGFKPFDVPAFLQL
jgi:hypothetical protein